MTRTFVIAEAGSCHDGNFGKALHLVLAAAECGADAVKFQFWSDADALADRRRVPQHYRETYRRYQVPLVWLESLKAECDLRGLEFMCSTYLPQDVATVAPFVKRFKVASFEAEDAAFVAAHAPFMESRELIVSLGMGANPGTALRAIAWVDEVKFLHCVSAYPAPVDSLNLIRLRRNDDEPAAAFYGFSDHSDPALTWTGAMAVAAGAGIIEAHLRLEGTDASNPDAPHAMVPRQFADYVRHIRFAEVCVGESTDHRAHPCESEMAQYRVRS